MNPPAIERWEHVVKSRDLDLLDELLADDVVFESPVVHTPQVGHAITRAYLVAALQVLNNPEFRYVRRWLGEQSAVLEFETRLAGLTINGVDIISWKAYCKERLMHYFQFDTIGFVAAILGAALILPNSALAQGQDVVAQAEQPNRVAVAYVPPKNHDLQELYGLLSGRLALEKIQGILSPLRLPEELTIKTAECGRVNSWYSRENSKPTVTICYELLKHVLESLPKETTSAGFTPDDAAIAQFVWFTLHEIGHAVFDIFNVPIFGNEEDAADNFATYIMLQNQMSETRRLIGGAAWAWWGYMADYKRNPVVQMRLEGFASDHGLPQERFYNLLCIAYGADPVMFDDLPQVGYLPPTRAPRCKREYKKLADAFQKEISPHIDQEMAKRVLQMNWLPGPVLRPEPRK